MDWQDYIVGAIGIAAAAAAALGIAGATVAAAGIAATKRRKR